MLGNISSLFDLDFGIRCFLPSLFLILGSACIHDIVFGSDELARLALMTTNRIETLAGSVYIGLLAWIGGVLISAIQRELVRILEGYGRFNPLKYIGVFRKRQLNKYRALRLQEADLIKKSKAQALSNTPETSTQHELTKVGLDLSFGFPSKESLLLPTSFGNSMRALEEYSSSMYGLDGVVGWTRLQAVIPTEYQKIIDGQRLYRDFWVNSCFVCLALTTEVIILCFLRPERAVVGLVLIVVLVSLICWTYESANAAAQRFGDYVRSAYDLYIDDLRKKLRLPKHDDPIEQRQIWILAGQAYAYRSKRTLDKLHQSAESETLDFK